MGVLSEEWHRTAASSGRLVLFLSVFPLLLVGVGNFVGAEKSWMLFQQSRARTSSVKK